MRTNIVVGLSALFLSFPVCLQAVTIVSAPTFAPAMLAPLAGTLTLTTDVPSRVSVQVYDGTNTWEKDFYDFGLTHSEPLFGFKPDRTNQIQVTVYDTFRNTATAGQSVNFVTPRLPEDFPTSVVLLDEPSQMEPGYTLCIVVNQDDGMPYIIILDNTGQVVWYSANSPSGDDVRQLATGDLFMPSKYGTNFTELNLLGKTVNTWPAAPGYLINLHDGVPTDHDTILYLTDLSTVLPNFPTSATNPDPPLVTMAVDYNAVVEISATNSALLNVWPLIDMLDPYRLTYLTFELTTALGLDIEHANAVIEDPSDNSIIVSLREQNAVIKFSRATGQLKWILGPPANWSASFQQYLLTPVGTPFEWNYGQHAPTLTPQGTLLLYDDGDYRASPFDPTVADQDNYSRAVEYSIDETNMQISQVWQSSPSNDDRLFTPIVGNPQWLPQTSHVLTTFGYVTFRDGIPPSLESPAATMVRIKEFTHDADPSLVFDVCFFDFDNTSSFYNGYFCYRSHRIPDLYGHPLAAVADLNVIDENGTAHLQFSGDPTLTYSIQASPDLVNWTTIEATLPETGSGEFDFYDLNADQYSARYYRVLTEQP